MRPAQRSSRASHGRQRKEMEAQDWGFAVGSLRKPLWWMVSKVAICLVLLFSVCITVRRPGRFEMFDQ